MQFSNGIGSEMEVEVLLDGGETEAPTSLLPARFNAEDATSTSVTLTWQSPPYQLLGNEAGEIRGYKLTVKGERAEQNFNVKSDETDHLVTGLIPKGEYTATIATETKTGSTLLAQSIDFQTKASVPARVAQPVMSEITATTVVINWKVPDSHGEEISGYELYSSTAGDGADFSPLSESGALRETGIGPTTRMITNLSPDTMYVFQVAAINKIGAGPNSKSTLVFTTPKPEVPSAVSAMIDASDVTSNGVTLKWPPAQGNGQSVLKYLVFKQTGSVGPFLQVMDVDVKDLIQTSKGYSLRVGDLLAGEKYAFKLAAVNAVGIGAAGEPSEQVQTRPGVPEAPGSVAWENVGTTSLTLMWDAPVRDNGYPVTGYKILFQEGPGGFTTMVENTGDTRRVREITGLKHSGIAYTFKVQAYNAMGWSPASTPCYPATTLEDRAAKKAAAIALESGFDPETAVQKLSVLLEQARNETIYAKQAAEIAQTAEKTAHDEAEIASNAKQMCQQNLEHEKELMQVQLASKDELAHQEIVESEKMSRKSLDNIVDTLSKERYASKLDMEACADRISAFKARTTKAENELETAVAQLAVMKAEGCKLGVKRWCPLEDNQEKEAAEAKDEAKDEKDLFKAADKKFGQKEEALAAAPLLPPGVTDIPK